MKPRHLQDIVKYDLLQKEKSALVELVLQKQFDEKTQETISDCLSKELRKVKKINKNLETKTRKKVCNEFNTTFQKYIKEGLIKQECAYNLNTQCFDERLYIIQESTLKEIIAKVRIKK